MPRIDDYKNAVEIAKTELTIKNPKRIASLSGAEFEGNSEEGGQLKLEFLNRIILISWPDLVFSIAETGDEVPLQQQVLLLHYLVGAAGSRELGDWIAYQEIPDGKFYLDAFVRRAKNPMLQGFGDRPELLAELAAELYGADPLDQGDVSVVVHALPMVPVALVLWKGDEEFPPDGTILFDRSISHILSAEDIAWLAGMIIYPLLGTAGKRK
ncbi:MAG: DUF3786 domain-containing protein [Desulfatiglandaceae bacterium]